MRSKQNYLLIERLEVIRKTLKAGLYASTTLLKKRIMDSLGTEVSSQTLYRDVNFLRDRMGLDIRYDSSKRGYYIPSDK